MTSSTRSIAVDDGCRLAVTIRNTSSPTHPPIVLLHALGMRGSMWDRVIECLDTDLPLIVLDCRGHGDSDKPGGPYATERFARDVVCVLQALGHDSAFIAGCSMGGTVAQAVAVRDPRRVAGLALFDTTAWYGCDGEKNWEVRAATAQNQGVSALIDFQLERWFSPDFRVQCPGVVQQVVETFLANPPQAYASSCRRLGRADERAGLASYCGPAVVALGADDYATPVAMAQDIVARIPGATLTVIAQARHFAIVEQPQAAADCIRNLLDTRSNRPSSQVSLRPFTH